MNGNCTISGRSNDCIMRSLRPHETSIGYPLVCYMHHFELPFPECIVNRYDYGLDATDAVICLLAKPVELSNTTLLFPQPGR